MERLTSPNINVDPGTDRFLHAAIGGKEIDWKQSRDRTLHVLLNGPTSNGFCKDIFRKMARDLYGQLKAYEDTKRTPEQIEALEAAIMGKAVAQITEFEGLPIARLRELAVADQEGRVIVLPCKVGAYMIDQIFPERPRLMKNVRPSIVYVSKGAIYNMTLETFESAVLEGLIIPASEEAEKAMKGETEK